MKKDNPANRPFMNTTTFVIFLPFLALGLLMPGVGMFDSIRSILGHGRWFDYPIIILLSSLYITSVLLILWKSSLGQGLGIFYLLLILMAMYATTRSDLAPSVRAHVIAIGRVSHIHGVDVYCNDVYLGQTPLVISEEDFRQKVKPWKQPPRQDIILGIQGMSYKSPRNIPRFLYYGPKDYFERYRKDRRSPYAYRQSHWRETLRTSRYWWHFEKDGCVGVAPIGGGGGASGGRTITIHADPEIMYPSVKPHLELLLHSLRRSRYEPTDEWVTHFRKYAGLLFHDFYQKSQDDTQLTPALHAVVKAEFGISDEMTEEEVARDVDEILARVERVGAFTIPSPESVAFDLLGRRASKAVEKRFVDLATLAIGLSRASRFDEGQITTFYRQGRPALRLPLEYAIQQFRPPGLFNQLVYESHHGNNFIGLVGNYRREAAVRLVQHYLQGTDKGGIRKLSRVLQATGVANQIHNPELEEDLRRFVGDNAEPHGLLITFIESRLDSPVTGASSLARWIFHLPHLNERDKLEYLSRVNSPRTYDHIQNLLMRGDYSRRRVIEYLEQRPNPALDQFLIDSYEYYQTPPTALVQAMLICDTPKMRAYLNELWNEGTDEQSFLLEEMSKMELGHMNLARWIRPISELIDLSLRLLAVPVLSQIDTPEAATILESWAAEKDEQLRILAQEHLDNHRERDRQTADLIAGKIKPDDLLPPQIPYVWDGQNYVPELPATGEQ